MDANLVLAEIKSTSTMIFAARAEIESQHHRRRDVQRIQQPGGSGSAVAWIRGRVSSAKFFHLRFVLLTDGKARKKMVSIMAE
jgi:hypothetical protein